MAGVVVLRRILPQFWHGLALTGTLRDATVALSGLSRRLPWRSCPATTIHLCPVLLAGHNKWSKVKHIKGPRDAARSRQFMKLSLMIRVAVKEGGSDPEFNLGLANVIEQCRRQNMPKASIEAAIKGAEKSKAGTQIMFEARGHSGFMLLIEVLTDNNTRTHQDIKGLLHKHGAALCDGARHSFSRKGVVVTEGEGLTLERALELAIEAGAEDVQEIQDEENKPLLQFLCAIAAIPAVRSALEACGLRAVSAAPDFVAVSHARLAEAQLEEAAALLEALTEHADVVRVWDNVQA